MVLTVDYGEGIVKTNYCLHVYFFPFEYLSVSTPLLFFLSFKMSSTRFLPLYLSKEHLVNNKFSIQIL